MAKPLVSDELWAVIEALLPPKRPKPKGGRMAERVEVSEWDGRGL
jgi:transposase